MSTSPLIKGTTTAKPTQEPDRRIPAEVGLTSFEADRVRELIGREPNGLEWGMFGAMWSEHCAYKHSRPLLRTLPSSGAAIAPGENAGAVDLGDGLLCVFKVESHNHPSAVEPYQGAATGVGGILRDVFAMGARPVAVLNALFFGAPEALRTRRLVGGVVGGISFYGNCVGIPDVGGHVSFEPCFERTPLVNAMCVGLVRREHLRTAGTARPGSAVYLVGSDTGRDGIAGASLLASFELGSADDAKRPSVQVGNPFLEKLLMEATLELVERDAIEAIQDLGAAGLTCATSEISAKSGVGMRIDVDRVPRRASGMIPYEVMLSESQERMLVIARPGRERDVEEVFRRWELHGTRIGEVIAEPVLEIRSGGEIVATLPPAVLVDQAPEYDLSTAGGPTETLSTDGPAEAGPESRSEAEVTPWGPPGAHAPAPPHRGQRADRDAAQRSVAGTLGGSADDPDLLEPDDLGQALLDLVASPAVASRRVIYRTYDQMVGTDTVVGPGGDAAILRIKGRRDGIAIAIDAQPRVAAIDPFVGAAAAVAEAARNLVCMGAEPLGVTDCLNLGNPERQPGASQLRETVAGITAACRELGVPVVSGNVSLYNATRGADIWPTATIGAVGRLADVTEHIPVRTGEEGDLVLLAGDPTARLGASAFAAMRDVHEGPVAIDLGLEARLQRAVLAMHRARLVRAAHDRAEGGLAVALAELAIRDGVGLRVTLPAVRGMSLLASLFGEGPSGIVLVVAPRDEARVRALAEEHDVPLRTLGAVGGRDLRIAGVLGVPVSALARAHDEGLPRALGRAPASRADRSGEALYRPPASRQEA